MILHAAFVVIVITGSQAWRLIPPSYTLLKKMDTFEIRKYPSIKIATAEERDNDFYDEKVNTFLSIYKYVSGENDRVERLGLNLPLIDQIIFGSACHTTKYYARNYIIPAAYQEDPPRPTNEKNKVKLRSFEERTMCVRTFPDWATRSQITKHMGILQNDLKGSNIAFDSDEIFVIELSAPWQVVNRTNEVSFTCSYVVKDEDVKEKDDTVSIGTMPDIVNGNKKAEETQGRNENDIHNRIGSTNKNNGNDGKMHEIMSDSKPIE